MSRELDALWRIYNLTDKSYEDYTIIETVLKNDDKEKFELIEQVRELKDEIASLNSFNSKLWVEREDNQKALKIIKEKRVNVDMLMEVKDADIYNGFACNSGVYRRLTQEEFDILKEVLK